MKLFRALILAISVGCSPQIATPTQAPTSASATSVGSSPSVAPAGTPPATPRSIVQGLDASALGVLRGDWVFAIRETYVPENVRVRVDVLATPLPEQGPGAARGPQVVASYMKSAGGVTLPPGEVLPRQFSADGRRLALNTPMGIVVVELETGVASLLAEGQDPVWGSGARIAFIRGDPSAPRTLTTTWIIPAAGGAPADHPCGAAFAWTYDGSACIRPAAGGLILDFPDQPGTAPALAWSITLEAPGRGGMPLSVRPAAGVTVLAVASNDLPSGAGAQGPTLPDPSYEHRIEVLSTPGGGSRTVVASERGRFIEVRFAEPRWNPRADQILYRIEGSRRRETHIVDLSTKQDVVARISGIARAAEWTPNGEQIVYLTDPRNATGPATEVRAVRPISGRDDRLLLAATGVGVSFTSVAVRGYGTAERSEDVTAAKVARAQSSPADGAAGARAIEALAVDLYRELGREPGDLVFSPYSVAAALAMTRAGASGETAEQMDHVLHADIAGDLDLAMNALDLALARRSGDHPYGQRTVPLELATANQLWGQRGTEFGQEFLDRLAMHYGAGMRLVDYVNAREDARQAINEWVSDRTRARIPEVIPADALNALTRLVLTNAIYLNAKWVNEFGDAQPASFHRLDGSTVQVPLMRRIAYDGHGSGDRYQAVRLAYVGGLSMIVIVPDAGEFATVEASLTDAARLRAVMDGVSPKYVNLGLPRFEMRTSVGLSGILARLGMPIAFTGAADFSKMSPQEPVLIQSVLHEAFITVDEQGTEAAAATAVVGGATGGPSVDVVLSVDRPFVFVIEDDETGAILFMGRVLDPSAD